MRTKTKSKTLTQALMSTRRSVSAHQAGKNGKMRITIAPLLEKPVTQVLKHFDFIISLFILIKSHMPIVPTETTVKYVT
jgi:hypothetical protein